MSQPQSSKRQTNSKANKTHLKVILNQHPRNNTNQSNRQQNIYKQKQSTETHQNQHKSHKITKINKPLLKQPEFKIKTQNHKILNHPKQGNYLNLATIQTHHTKPNTEIIKTKQTYISYNCKTKQPNKANTKQ